MTRDEFNKGVMKDSNLWWRLSSGDHLNLYDEADELCDELQADLTAAQVRIAELEGEKESLIDSLEKAFGLIPTWRERGRVVTRRNGMYGSLVIECADELEAALKED